MIAEKTADAIKGRKLTPFEPPTRVATGSGYNRQQKHYPGANMYASSSSINYGKHLPQSQSQNQHHYVSYDQKQLHYPPPIGQQNIYSQAPYLSRSLAKELAAAASIPSSNTTLLSEIPALIRKHGNAGYLAGGGLGLQGEPFETVPSSEDIVSNSDHDFLLRRYSSSKMKDNLIKRVSPIR